MAKEHKKQRHAKNMENPVEEALLDVAIMVSRQGKGCLLVIGNFKEGKNKDYVCHFPNFFANGNFYVRDKGMREALANLSTIDGAVIVEPNGRIAAYGARILHTATDRGHGTRHSAAKGASLKGDISILASEQAKIVRIYRDGAKVMEIDPFTKDIEKKVPKIVRVLESPETVGVIAGAAAMPIVGVPGVIIFAGSYLLSKKIIGMVKQIEFK